MLYNAFRCKISLLITVVFITVAISVTAQPKITGYSPRYVTVGDVVTITGSGFSATPAQNIVYFGAVKATVLTASATKLTAKAPAGTTYAPITVTKGGLTASSPLPCVITFPGDLGGLDMSNFGSRMSVPATGQAIFGIAVADFNNDGKPDLITANADGKASLSIFKNTSSSGSITFGERTDIQLGIPQIFVSTADLDGDGRLDIITAGGILAAALNTTTGDSISFGPFTSVAAGGGYQVAAVACDLDGDGKPDIATANIEDSTVTVLHNACTPGHIAFTNATYYSTPYKTTFVAINDVTGDGKPEVLASSTINPDGREASSLSVFKNNSIPGTIGLLPAVNYDLPHNTEYFATCDIDNDGRLDIATSNTGSNSISILKNNTTGNIISFESRLDYSGFAAPYYMVFGDLGGDKRPDILTANYQAAFATTFANYSATITDFSTVRKFTTDGASYSVAIADLDADGKPEIIAGNTQFSTGKNVATLNIYKNNEPLPLQLLAFTGQMQHNATQLQWQTANEQNTAYFNIERQANNSNVFTTIGKLTAAGYSPAQRKYTFADVAPEAGVNYYRLKMVDADGKFTYSNTIRIVNGDAGLLVMYPNPAKQFVTVKHPASAKASLALVDAQGKTINTVNIAAGALQTTINVKNIAAGTYTIIWGDGTRRQSKALVVER